MNRDETKLRRYYTFDTTVSEMQQKAASLNIELSRQEAACLVHSKCNADGSVKTDILDAYDVIKHIPTEKLAKLLFD